MLGASVGVCDGSVDELADGDKLSAYDGGDDGSIVGFVDGA